MGKRRLRGKQRNHLREGMREQAALAEESERKVKTQEEKGPRRRRTRTRAVC